MIKSLVQCLEASMCSISVVIIVHSLSRVWLLETPWTAVRQASLSFTISQSLLKPGACPLSQWCHPIILPSVVSFSSCLQSFLVSGSFPMSHLFASRAEVSELHSQHQYLPWIFSIDFLEVQGTLKSLLLLQHHSSKASILWCSALWSNSHIRTWLLEKP